MIEKIINNYKQNETKTEIKRFRKIDEMHYLQSLQRRIIRHTD